MLEKLKKAVGAYKQAYADERYWELEELSHGVIHILIESLEECRKDYEVFTEMYHIIKELKR